VDGRVDGAVALTCYEKWLTNTIRFDTPVPIAEINSTGNERDPFVSADELTIYWASAGEVWTSKRSTISSPFSMPVEADAFTSTSVESKLSISADHKVAVVGSNRPGSVGIDVWEAIRASVTDQWPAMNRINVMMLETSGNDHDPTISANAQRIYLAPDTPSPQHIAVATQMGNGVFGAPAAITELNTNAGDADPSPMPDERVLVFSSMRAPATTLAPDLWYATRASATGTFDPPMRVPDLNTSAAEGDPHVSSDGCRVYFGRDVGGGNWDILVATAL
jgi:hypothetical protein